MPVHILQSLQGSDGAESAQFQKTLRRQEARFPLYRKGDKHWRTARGQHENSQNRFVASGDDSIIGYESFAPIDMSAPRPLLMIAGSEADTRSCIS